MWKRKFLANLIKNSSYHIAKLWKGMNFLVNGLRFSLMDKNIVNKVNNHLFALYI